MRRASGFEEVLIKSGTLRLPGLLSMPDRAEGIVIFAHGSGSSRLSTRNQAVAHWLVERRCATLLFDLLTEDEAKDRRNVFDIELLGKRVVDVTRWWRSGESAGSLRIGIFGASTGAAAALVAAAELGEEVAVVVSRGGRPDLAIPVLPIVTSPTLLIVGSQDKTVIDLNRKAQAHLNCENSLVLIEGATHLFEEPGTLEQAGQQAGDWFLSHF